MRTHRNNSGFAMVLVLSIMTLLMTFLIAAQGSVMFSYRNSKRSVAHMERAAATNALLDSLRYKLQHYGNSSSGPTDLIVNTRVALKGECRKLDPNDPIYARLAIIPHHPGDALAVISWSEGSNPKAESYLINFKNQRSCAIRIP